MEMDTHKMEIALHNTEMDAQKMEIAS